MFDFSTIIDYVFSEAGFTVDWFCGFGVDFIILLFTGGFSSIYFSYLILDGGPPGVECVVFILVSRSKSYKYFYYKFGNFSSPIAAFWRSFENISLKSKWSINWLTTSLDSPVSVRITSSIS